MLWVSDPGDNVLADVGHLWETQPRDLPIHYGRRRPTLVLEPAGVFTVTGAVVIAARGRPVGPRLTESRAEGMTDLSQDINSAWPGLCGPTSVADVLFAMQAGGHSVLDGQPRGPGAEADAGVVQLLAGTLDRITPASLAGRMGIGQEGAGATNNGLRDGTASWLDERAPNRWDVRLDWFDDELRTREDQQAFFARLAGAMEAGGGAVLCLWPGAEYADDAVDHELPPEDLAEAGEPPGGAADAEETGQADAPPADSAAAGAADMPPPIEMPDLPRVPDAAFPAVHVPESGGPALSGGGGEGFDPDEEAAEGRRKLDQARSRLGAGSLNYAMRLAMQAVDRLDRAAAAGADCQADLAAAMAFCRDLERRLPSGTPTARVTEYK